MATVDDASQLGGPGCRYSAVFVVSGRGPARHAPTRRHATPRVWARQNPLDDAARLSSTQLSTSGVPATRRSTSRTSPKFAVRCAARAHLAQVRCRRGIGAARGRRRSPRGSCTRPKNLAPGWMTRRSGTRWRPLADGPMTLQKAEKSRPYQRANGHRRRAATSGVTTIQKQSAGFLRSKSTPRGETTQGLYPQRVNVDTRWSWTPSRHVGSAVGMCG